MVATRSALTSVGWTHLAPYPFATGIQNLQLLMDGSVLAADSGSGHLPTWHRFIPSPTTGYAGGTWVTAASSHYYREGFATGMLPDGRYWVGGGEHVYLNGQQVPVPHVACEIYNPATDTWSDTPDFPQAARSLEDGVTAPLPDGRMLVADIDGDSRVFDYRHCPSNGSGCATNAWGDFDTLSGPPWPDEGSMTMLWNGNIFLTQGYFDGSGSRITGAAIYTWNAAAPRWSKISHGANQGPNLDPFGGGEGGSALTLYDGRVFITGGSGHNGIYDSTPGLADPIQNTADTPGLAQLAENNQLVLPTGNVLALAKTQASLEFKFYEWTPPGSGLTQGSFSPQLPGSPTLSNYVMSTLLPDGAVMIAALNDLYLYRPAGNQLTTGKPTIGTVAGFVNGLYTLTGTNLNGLTNGANKDDEGHNFTSFPIVAATFGSQTQYCPVVNVYSLAIAPNVTRSIQFRMPSNVPVGPVTISVSTSGLQGVNTVSVPNTLYLPLPDAVLL